MFVVVVVDVMTYSFPVLGLTPPLSDPVRARRLVLTSCFLNLQVRQMRSAIISGGLGESIVYCILLYTHIVSFVTSLLSSGHQEFIVSLFDTVC